MLMLTRRLQILIDEDRFERLEEAARRRGTSVAGAVREAIDMAFAQTDAARQAAADRILAAPQMDAPSLEELKAELDEIRAGRG